MEHYNQYVTSTCILSTIIILSTYYARIIVPTGFFKFADYRFHLLIFFNYDIWLNMAFQCAKHLLVTVIRKGKYKRTIKHSHAKHMDQCLPQSCKQQSIYCLSNPTIIAMTCFHLLNMPYVQLGSGNRDYQYKDGYK